MPAIFRGVNSPVWPISSYQNDTTEYIVGNRSIPAGARWHEPAPYTTASNALVFLEFQEEFGETNADDRDFRLQLQFLSSLFLLNDSWYIQSNIKILIDNE